MPTIPATTEQATNSNPEEKKETKKRKPAKKAKKPATKHKLNGKPKTKTKKKGKKERKTRARKEGLLNIQARVLVVLNKSKGHSLTAHEIAARAGLTPGITVQYIGHLDAKARKYHEDTYLHHNTLLTDKLVKDVQGAPRKLSDGTYSDEPGATEFEITAAGVKAITSEEGKAVVKKLKAMKPIKLKK